MSTPELLRDLLVTIQCLQKELAGSDLGEIETAREAYRELLDGFWEEYQGMMAPQQYRAAKNDPDYFLAMIDLACFHEEEPKKGQSK